MNTHLSPHNPHVGATSERFRSVILVGPVPVYLIPEGVAPVQSTGDPAIAANESDARKVVRIARGMDTKHQPCLVLTTQELHLRGRVSVFGYADTSLRAAVLSVGRLSESATRDVLRMRVENAATHELGHLAGLGHCSHECVMGTVASVAELDRRPSTHCGNCPRLSSRIVTRFAALAIIIAVLVGIDFLLSDNFMPVATPFSCFATDATGAPAETGTGASDEAGLFFKGRRFLTLYDKGEHRSIRDRSMPVMSALNQSVRSASVVPVSVMSTVQGKYAVAFEGGSTLLEVLPKDLRDGKTAAQVAKEWATSINSTLAQYERSKR